MLEEEEELNERAIEIVQTFSIVDFERSATERAAEISELSEKKSRDNSSPFSRVNSNLVSIISQNQLLLQEVTENLLETIDHIQTRIELIFRRESMNKFQKTIRTAPLFDGISVEHDTDDPTAIAIKCFDETGYKWKATIRTLTCSHKHDLCMLFFTYFSEENARKKRHLGGKRASVHETALGLCGRLQRLDNG